MYIFGYLRASTSEQDAKRAQATLKAFAEEKGVRVAGWYIENVSGASLQRPELMRLLDDAAEGDAILIEQVDRLSRLDADGWDQLKHLLQTKKLKIISLDLPTSHIALSKHDSDQFTDVMLRLVNDMLLEMLIAISRKDYEDRRRRQAQGIAKAKQEGKFGGRAPDLDLHKKIRKLRVENGLTVSETANLAGVSTRTVIRVTKGYMKAPA